VLQTLFDLGRGGQFAESYDSMTGRESWSQEKNLPSLSPTFSFCPHTQCSSFSLSKVSFLIFSMSLIFSLNHNLVGFVTIFTVTTITVIYHTVRSRSQSIKDDKKCSLATQKKDRMIESNNSDPIPLFDETSTATSQDEYELRGKTHPKTEFIDPVVAFSALLSASPSSSVVSSPFSSIEPGAPVIYSSNHSNADLFNNNNNNNSGSTNVKTETDSSLMFYDLFSLYANVTESSSYSSSHQEIKNS
jgi:hypothetical protein